MTEPVTILLARSPGSMTFGQHVAARLVGQRVTVERSGAEVATVARTWISADRREIWAEVDFDHTAIGEAAKALVAEGQAKLFE